MPYAPEVLAASIVESDSRDAEWLRQEKNELRLIIQKSIWPGPAPRPAQDFGGNRDLGGNAE
jgi:hypothetical protein